MIPSRSKRCPRARHSVECQAVNALIIVPGWESGFPNNGVSGEGKVVSLWVMFVWSQASIVDLVT